MVFMKGVKNMKIVKKYLKYIICFVFVLIIFSVSILCDRKTTTIKTKNVEKLSVKKNESKKEDKETIYIDIKGAVKNPGVYELDYGKRVIDAVNTAGGFLDEASTINLNLSKKLKDEDVVIVYTLDELTNAKKSDNTNQTCIKNECVCPDTSNTACISDKASTSAANQNAKVNINTASKEELMTLTGIGESKANNIIKYRDANGNFKAVEDLKKVSGIGNSIFNKIKDNITI